MCTRSLDKYIRSTGAIYTCIKMCVFVRYDEGRYEIETFNSRVQCSSFALITWLHCLITFGIAQFPTCHTRCNCIQFREMNRKAILRSFLSHTLSKYCQKKLLTLYTHLSTHPLLFIPFISHVTGHVLKKMNDGTMFFIFLFTLKNTLQQQTIAQI